MKLQTLVYFNDQREAFDDAVNFTTNLLKTDNPIEIVDTGSEFSFAISCDATDIYFLACVLVKFGEFTVMNRLTKKEVVENNP